MSAVRDFWVRGAAKWQFAPDVGRYARMEFGMFGPQVDPIVCADGFRMSVQAGSGRYSTPAEDEIQGAYTHWEIGYPSAKQDVLMPYAEDADIPTDTVYLNVPTDVVDALIETHGGIKQARAALAKADAS